jgi:putative aminopeptidase FrvX
MSPSRKRKTALRKPAAKIARRAKAPRPVRRLPRQAARASSRKEGIPLLRKLCEACGVSGDESAVREIVREALKGKVKEIRVDALGNLLVRCRTRGKTAKRVMIAAHMDEVGVVLMQPGSDGLWKFETVGGVDERTLPAKSLWIGKKRLPGVIGTKPAHLVEKEEVENPIKKDSLTIDVGAKDKEGALALCQPGDRAAFASPFRFERGILLGKALDDRLGVAVLAELAADPPAGIELLAAFTTQEEIGLRGAKVAAHALNPDLAVVIDATPAVEAPMWDGGENTVYNTRLGGGPAVYVFDSRTISSARLVRLFTAAAEKRGIRYQIRQPRAGGTDAGAIHLARAGIPSISVSVPCRNPHTPLSAARYEDWRGLAALVRAALEDLAKHGLP